MNELDEYLLVAYAVPIVAIIWAIADVRSLLVVAQLASLGLLIYGAVESYGVVHDAGVRLSTSGQRRLFLTGLLPYYLWATSVLMTTVCLQQVMAKARQAPTS